MILRPAQPAPASPGMISAWEAILRTQQQAGEGCWLITQPDHAALSGDIAQNLAQPGLDPQVLEAIALHDEGWREFDEAALKAAEAGGPRPRSFHEATPAEFVRAWMASIERAQAVVPIGGLMVSTHFSSLADDRLAAGGDTPEDAQRLRAFLEAEHKRRAMLRAQERRSPAEVERLVQALQFCDLLSLYLCCGAAENVEFPQRLLPQPLRLRRDREACLFEPTPFRLSFDLAIAARRPGPAEPRSCAIPFFLW